MGKIDLKDAYFSVPLNPKSPKFVSFKWKDLMHQFLCLCFDLGPATQNIYITTDGSHYSDEDEEVECLINNFSGRYFTDGCLCGGVDIGTGQSHLPFSEFTFSDQYKEICASIMSNHTVFGHGDKLNRYDYNSSTGETESDSKMMPRSSEEVISFNTGVESIYWEVGINSHHSSASITPISSNATSANIGVICSRKLQL